MVDNRPAWRLSRLSQQILVSEPTAAKPTEGALHGVKVLDLSTVIAAPTCAAFLADLGADVIKIERPGDPDVTRTWGVLDNPDATATPELHRAGQGGSQFTMFNRGKRAVAIDIGKPEGQATLKRMLKHVDVFVTNVRGRSLDKLGLNYDQVKEDCPRLIFAHVSAWGRTGPQVHDPGFDIGAWFARSGIQELARASDDHPMPRQVGGIGDSVLATQLTGFIGLALYQRSKTGQGQLVDASLMRSGIAANCVPMSAFIGGQRVGLGGAGMRETTEPGKRRTTITYFPFKAKCGQWVQFMDLVPQRGLPKLLKALELTWEEVLGEAASGLTFPEVISTTAATDPEGEWLRRASKIVDERFASMTWAEWQPIFMKHDVWYAVIQKFEDVWDDPQAKANGSFTDAPDVRHPIVAVPIKLSASKTEPRSRAPKYGEHTNDVLKEFGFTAEEEKHLRSVGAIE